MNENETITVEQVSDPDRFQVSVDGAVAGFTQYVDDDGSRIFFHTSVDEAYGGRGLAGKVVREALDQTRAAGLSVVAVCPYVKGYIEKHPEYADLEVAATQQHMDIARTQQQL